MSESNKPSRSAMSTKSAGDSKLHKAQSFQVKRIHRSQLQQAPYNPRKIDSYAKAKLEKNLRKAGLLEPLIWNERTGNLVGGHQRLSCLDAIAESNDYELDVSVVSLTPKQEREQNVALNNPSIQGTFDVPSLEELIQSTEDFSIEEAGFDRIDLEVLFGNDTMAELFEPRETDPELPPKPPKSKEEGQRMKAERQAHLEAKLEDEDSEFYCVVVFQSRAERERFMTGVGLEEDDRYVNGQRLATLLHIDLEQPKSPLDGNHGDSSDVG